MRRRRRVRRRRHMRRRIALEVRRVRLRRAVVRGMAIMSMVIASLGGMLAGTAVVGSIRTVSSVAQAAIDLAQVVVAPGAVLAVVFVIAIADSILAVAILLLPAVIVANVARVNREISDAIVHPASALVDFIRVHALQPRDLIRQFGGEDSLL